MRGRTSPSIRRFFRRQQDIETLGAGHDFGVAASLLWFAESGVVPPRLPQHEAHSGDFSPGHFGFVLSQVQLLSAPIAAKEMLGLWEVSLSLTKGRSLRVSTT